VLPFLDVKVTRLADGNLQTSVYRKPTFSGLFLKWESFVPKHFKKTLVYGLVNRAWKICSSYELFHGEVEFISSVLQANGYPANFINSCVKKCLDKLHSSSNNTVVYGPERKPVFVCLPYCGNNSLLLKRQLHRMFSVVAPAVSLKLVFKPVDKLNKLSKLKCRIPVLSKSNVVYRVNCNDCSEFYIGKTIRNLNVRLKEHATNEYSALYKHHVETSHNIDYDHPVVMANDSKEYRLLIKESLIIRDVAAESSLNRNVGSTDLKLW
jgi:hypothetical protein